MDTPNTSAAVSDVVVEDYFESSGSVGDGSPRATVDDVDEDPVALSPSQRNSKENEPINNNKVDMMPEVRNKLQIFYQLTNNFSQPTPPTLYV